MARTNRRHLILMQERINDSRRIGDASSLADAQMFAEIQIDLERMQRIRQEHVDALKAIVELLSGDGVVVVDGEKKITVWHGTLVELLDIIS